MGELSYTDIFFCDINMGDNAEYENYRRREKISRNKVSLCGILIIEHERVSLMLRLEQPSRNVLIFIFFLKER